MADNYITVAEAAARLGIGIKRVHQLIAENRLPSIQTRPGWPHLIAPKDLHLVADRKPGRPPQKKKRKGG